MWAALEAVQMKDYVEALPGGLDARVAEGGGNLSVGNVSSSSGLVQRLLQVAFSIFVSDACYKM